MARNLLAVKIGISAAVIPALGLSFLTAVRLHQSGHQKQAEKSPAPQLTEKQLGTLRKYVLPGDYAALYMFTDPYDPSKHCMGTAHETSTYRCYPNAPGITGHGGLLDMVTFKTPDIGDVRSFIDPENPALYCIGNVQTSNYMCYEKPQTATPQTFQPK